MDIPNFMEESSISMDEKYPNNGIGDNAKRIDGNTSDISDNREGLTETFEATLTNTDDVAINRQAIEELYEMILGSEVQ